MSSKTGGQAFPGGAGTNHVGGMSMRDYFASQALIGLIGNSHGAPSDFVRDCYRVAEISYVVADAMLKERGAV